MLLVIQSSCVSANMTLKEVEVNLCAPYTIIAGNLRKVIHDFAVFKKVC